MDLVHLFNPLTAPSVGVGNCNTLSYAARVESDKLLFSFGSIQTAGFLAPYSTHSASFGSSESVLLAVGQMRNIARIQTLFVRCEQVAVLLLQLLLQICKLGLKIQKVARMEGRELPKHCKSVLLADQRRKLG